LQSSVEQFGLTGKIQPLFLFPHCFGGTQLFAAFGAIGERLPCLFGPAATIAHMVERCRLSFRSRLGDTSKEEVTV
jgi:hypothetical protein